MPRANPNIVGAQATMLVLPRDTYEFKIGKPKTFSREVNRDGKTHTAWGLRYPMQVSGGDYDGKDVYVELYFHTEGSFPMNKQFLMAVMGYEMSQQGEEKFNADHADVDFVVDTDENYIADIWKNIEGSRVKADVDKQAYQGRDNNKFTWLPFN